MFEKVDHFSNITWTNFHLTNTASLNNATPYDLAQILLDENVLKKLNLEKVPANKIQLNTKLLKKN